MDCKLLAQEIDFLTCFFEVEINVETSYFTVIDLRIGIGKQAALHFDIKSSPMTDCRI